MSLPQTAFLRHTCKLNFKTYKWKYCVNTWPLSNRLSNSNVSRNLNASDYSTVSPGKKAGLQCKNLVTFTQVRHRHKIIDVDSLNLPHKYWGWWQRFFMYRYFGGEFNSEDFFKGVIMSFVYVSQCIAKDKVDQLYSVLTDKAREDIPIYIAHAYNDTTNMYAVGEKDIVYLHVKSASMNRLKEYEDTRNANVLSLGVWITYVKDFEKRLGEKDIIPEDGVKDHLIIIRDMMKEVMRDNKMARFQFERVYDRKLQNPLSDWMVSGIYYSLPKDKKE